VRSEYKPFLRCSRRCAARLAARNCATESTGADLGVNASDLLKSCLPEEFPTGELPTIVSARLTNSFLLRLWSDGSSVSRFGTSLRLEDEEPIVEPMDGLENRYEPESVFTASFGN